jgi:hypothetical protein
MRYKKINILNLQEVEQEIDFLISLAGDDPSEKTIKEVSDLIGIAKALGTRKAW